MASSFKSYVTKEIGIYQTPILTATASTTVIGFSLANITNNAVTVSAALAKYGNSTGYIVKNAPIPAGGSMIVVGAEQKVVMEVGDVLIVNANTGFAVDAIVSTLEIS